MAGRPAPSRGGGSSGLLYGLISFAILTVVSLVLFVLALTNVKSAQDEADKFKRQIESYGSPPAYYASEAGSRRSRVFDVMKEEISSLTTLISGHSDYVGPAVREFVQKELSDVAARHADVVTPNDTLLTAIGNLSKQLSLQAATAGQLRSELANAQARVTSLTQEKETVRAEFEAQVAELSQRVAAIEESSERTLAQKDEQLTGLTASLDAASQDLQQLRRETLQQSRDWEFELNRQRAQVDDLQQKVFAQRGTQFDPDAILKKADGRIIRAVPGSDIVYIGIGQQNGVKVGMGFEVFSQTGEVRESVRGKASLEVVTLMSRTAECRVTRVTPGQPILEGDLIVSITFEQGRRPKFVVRGDFDLDFDGLVDPDGPSQIAALIRQWGGQVIDDLDESVDFVVIGVAPVGGKATSMDSEIVRDQRFHRQMRESQFRELVARAGSMYIPVITQNQFLFLTGYSGQGAILPR